MLSYSEWLHIIVALSGTEGILYIYIYIYICVCVCVCVCVCKMFDLT